MQKLIIITSILLHSTKIHKYDKYLIFATIDFLVISLNISHIYVFLCYAKE